MNCPHCGSSQLYKDAPYICCLRCGYERHIELPIVAPPPEDPKPIKFLKARPINQRLVRREINRHGKPSRDAIIIRLHKEGKTQKEIYAACGSCPKTIVKVIKGAGLTPLKRGRHSTELSEYRKTTIRRLYREGKPVRVIARTVGTKRAYIYQVLSA